MKEKKTNKAFEPKLTFLNEQQTKEQMAKIKGGDCHCLWNWGQEWCKEHHTSAYAVR